MHGSGNDSLSKSDQAGQGVRPVARSRRTGTPDRHGAVSAGCRGSWRLRSGVRSRSLAARRGARAIDRGLAAPVTSSARYLIPGDAAPYALPVVAAEVGDTSI